MTRLQTRQTVGQKENRETLSKLFRNSPIPPEELAVNLPLYLRSSVLAKVLYVNELYQLVLETPGVIMEFGAWWGANLVLFENLRAVHEPYNHTRRIIGFDTFEGYPGVTEKDGSGDLAFAGNYAVGSDYLEHLNALLACHQNENVMGHIEKVFTVKGDAAESLPRYLEDNPETIVSLAYFDMQLYEPTKACLEAVKPFLTKGSVIAMDELNCPEFPGETEAFREVFGTANVRLQRSRFLPDRSFFKVE